MILASLVLAAAAAAPAAAQAVEPYTQFQLDDLRARQEAAERAAVREANELTALEARLRTEQALTELQAQRLSPRLPELRYELPTLSAPFGAASYLSVPDAVLADSNRRVQAAAANRR